MSRRTMMAAGALAALTGSAGLAGPALAAETTDGVAAAALQPTVVVDGLNNPRQLNWSADGQTLVIAEAGRGAATPEECTEPTDPEAPPECMGPTGSISTVHQPWQASGTAPQRVIEGLRSFSDPSGMFALGATGADAIEAEHPGDFVAAMNGDNPIDSGQAALYLSDSMGEPPPPGTPEDEVLPGGDLMFTLANLFQAESEMNPGGAQIESNPYAILFVDPTPEQADNDGYALVADAGANAVWKVEPDYDAVLPPECESENPPADFDFSQCVVVDVTVFAAWEDRGNPPEGLSEEELAEWFANAPPEFVPTSLASDSSGAIYVGGLGSEIPGEASVVKFDTDGNQLQEWGDFTAITGLAVHGDHLYVSQLLGDEPLLPPGEEPSQEVPPLEGTPGSVTRVSMTDPTGERVSMPAPLPAGLAVDEYGLVYVAVNSIAPAEGAEQGPFGGPLDPGAVWRLSFAEPGPRPIDSACPDGLGGDHPFTDVPDSSPFAQSVGCVWAWEITRGTSATAYSPRMEVTREQMAAFIARLVVASGGELPAQPQEHFGDDESSNFEMEINQLAEVGVVKGTGVETYSPKLRVTRAQMAALLVRAYNFRAEQEGAETLSSPVDFFSDDDWSSLESHINTAASVGIAAGYTDGTFRPSEGVRRDHMAAFISRQLDLMVDSGLAAAPAAQQ